jgi:hypothetical protein
MGLHSQNQRPFFKARFCRGSPKDDAEEKQKTEKKGNENARETGRELDADR